MNKPEEDYWTKNGLTKPTEIIVCAANRHPEQLNLIVCGARHWDSIMREQYRSLANKYKGGTAWWEQGFINQWGEFRTRQEAYKIVQENGQPFNAERNGGNGKDLYSEGLY